MSKGGGLAGIIAGDSAIATVGHEGSGLNYRGYSINDLAEKSTFEEVFYLLMHERLPLDHELDRFSKDLAEQRHIPMHMKKILELIPATAHPMDVMRCVSSVMGTLEPEDLNSKYPVLEAQMITKRLVSIFGPSLMYWHHYHKNGMQIDTYTGNDSTASNFMKLFELKHTAGSEPVDPIKVETIDKSLILYAEHDFNASTFAARVTVSTNSDMYSAITTGVGTLRGNLHGGANEAAMEFLAQFSTVEEADAKLRECFA